MKARKIIEMAAACAAAMAISTGAPVFAEEPASYAAAAATESTGAITSETQSPEGRTIWMIDIYEDDFIPAGTRILTVREDCITYVYFDGGLYGPFSEGESFVVPRDCYCYFSDYTRFFEGIQEFEVGLESVELINSMTSD